MKITRDNYESFFLDYLEGNLEETMIDQFLDFLKQNPDLKEELHLFENIPLPKEPIVFPVKESLYKTSGSENESFDRRAVAYLEGDLKEKERRAFETSLAQNPKLQAEYALFEKTRLIPDPEIQFQQKEKLYKKSGAILWINWMGRAAAILILLWGISTLFHTGQDLRIPADSKKVASVKEPSSSQPKVTEPGVKEPARPTIASTAKNRVHPVNPPKAKIQPSASGLERQDNLREASGVEPLASIPARLEDEPVEIALAPINRLNKQRINNRPAVMTLDEYLALKAKKATNEGLLSANRLLRAGLNVASEISGERLGYTVRNGKVASLDFESKLLAFEIPLEKKN